MILVDTSVWIDHFRNIESSKVLLLRTAINDQQALIGDLIVMEILQGVTSEDAVDRLRARLAAIPQRRIARAGIPELAAENYRALRRQGFTPRNAVDTLIATFAIRYRLPLLHNDRDFDPFERHLGLQVVRAG